MLNELVIVERGAPQEEVEAALRHQDIQETSQTAKTLRVSLDIRGQVVHALPVPSQVKLWTLRNHNKNSFHFVRVMSLLNDDAVNLQRPASRLNTEVGGLEGRS